MESPKDVAEILDGISHLGPKDITDAISSLSDKERAALAREILPTHDELQAYIDDISDPDSPNYDPDLAS